MQTLDWYYHRLTKMSPREVAWRMRSFLRDRSDRFLIGHRQRLRNPAVFLNGDGQSPGPGFHVSDIAVGEKAKLSINDEADKRRYDSLIDRAERIAEHRLDIFDLKDKYLAERINWNHDYKRMQDTPLTFSPALDYRDVETAGDCKFVWEPNRHHQLVVLGRAYRASGNIRYANAVAELLDSWLKQNPYGVGMNWRSGLELGIRLINWVWALYLIKDSGAIDDDLQLRLLDSIARHIWEIDRKYSYGSSVNNHLIGEAAGVFVATSYFKNLKQASTWRQSSRDILNREIINQTFPDGGTAEQAIGYHFFVLQFFVIAGLTSRATGQDMPESYWSRLEKMFEFLVLLSEGGDNLPMFGDCDDGYVLDLCSNPHSIKDWLAVGAALFGRSDFKAVAGNYGEPIEWLPGELGWKSFEAIPESQNETILSRPFKESGYYLLQYGELNRPERISVLFDCGPLGMEPLAAHGHADALSFTLRAFGTDVLVDPGTYDYFSYPKWRRYFRSTAAHNTVVIDGLDQSEMLGLFLWGRRANARCLNWELTDTGARFTGEHDGYTHLKDPVTHRRTLELNKEDCKLVIRDDIIARSKHKIDVYFHLAENCTLSTVGSNCYLVDAGPGTVTIELDPRLNIEQFKGNENLICGWVSRGYHQKKASTTLVGRCISEGNTTLICRINIGELKQAAK
jgi:uncharacterized heparinase superfamily protein